MISGLNIVVCRAVRVVRTRSTTFCTECSNGRKVESFVRNAQAAELFRANFFSAKNRESTIPLEDLDQLVTREKVRPSLLLLGMEVAGTGLGVVSRFLPKEIATGIATAVDDASVQQFNDSIRTMQLESVDNVDVKETLKYHRELRGEGEHQGMGGTNADESATPVQSTSPLDAQGALTSVLYHALKLSEKF